MPTTDPELRAELDAIDAKPPPRAHRPGVAPVYTTTRVRFNRFAYLTVKTIATLLGESPGEFIRRAAVHRAQVVLGQHYRKKRKGLTEARADAKAGIRLSPTGRRLKPKA